MGGAGRGDDALPGHPYWPRELSLPGYRENRLPLASILGFLFGVSAALVAGVWLLSGRAGLGCPLRRLAVCWFAVCGFIHGVVEGWFSLWFREIPGDQAFLSQLCEHPWGWG
ncbi:3-beta-hydroxysteroid-Delta(8),Delta(7)-isomerase [Rhincodon typus]|uniref:3-beta-hydroxysteroid-Delta(8), Delta(7)-isomerase n=1 Tax=Rhincodon typus TaxID=259920 RepID=UPI002030B709|nr:3-beta-hydroxysteroid-Delta(8),Delta(7)-isomerase [Rhincodon typus]